VTVGVDTHTDVHVAAVLDRAGRLLGTASFPATTRDCARLATWTESFGQVDKVGMEGTGVSVPGCCDSWPTTAWP
jgi:transposase